MSYDRRDELRARYALEVSTVVETAKKNDAPGDAPDMPHDHDGDGGKKKKKKRKKGLELDVEKAFVVEGAGGRTVITAPLREQAAANGGFLYLNGRFVEADRPNRNGALWSAGDLELGQHTVAGGPLNWLHQDTNIIGCLTDSSLVDREAAAADGIGAHITAKATVWQFLFPEQARTIASAAGDRNAFFSMECLSKEVACVDTPGRPGCGESVGYLDYLKGNCCAHLREKSSVRRFVEPTFLGGAIIVPPVQPGWGKAEVDVVRQAAAAVERADLVGQTGLSWTQAELMTARILTWANRA